MKGTKQIKTIEASIENTKRLFANTSDDVVLLKDAFVAWGRPNPEDVEANKSWLSNTLYHLKYHDLVTPGYSFSGGRKKLVKLQLTLKGKKALGRIGESIESSNENRQGAGSHGNGVDFRNVNDVVARLKEANPEWEFGVEMRLKTDKG